MPPTRRVIDCLGAFVVVLAFGALFVGKVVMYPVAFAPGSFLERLRAEAFAWDLSHAIMTVGLVATIPAAMALARALRAQPWWLVGIGQMLVILAGALGVGQFALDYALLAAAHLESPEAGAEFDALVRAYPFVDYAFYRVANPAWIGLAFFAIAMWMQRGWWRIAGTILACAVVFKTFESTFGPIGSRISLGIQLVGLSIAAWRMAIGDHGAKPLADA